MSNKVCNASAIFTHPEPEAEQHRILPVFIPFSGCRQRCAFCAQDLQTGRQAGAVEKALQEAGQTLARLHTRPSSIPTKGTGEKPPLPDLAFYGGTFTALAPEDLEACLAFGRHWMERGLIGGLRCSTRPDALSPALLQRLRESGFNMVELGIQSFSSSALEAAGRGYTRDTALEACAMVRESGLKLGIQLMPGMPGVDPETARNDVLTTAKLRPDCARLYPCLVLEGSGLASLWRKGMFTPWEETPTLEFLAWSCLRLWQKDIRVIRMGLAPEDGLDAAILAGPKHPSMGSRARGLALCMLIEEQAKKLLETHPESQQTQAAAPRLQLTAPRRYQGEFWGFRKELQPRYAKLGISGTDQVQWHDGREFILRYEE
jgi:histone acetyltransferase (RNA polymerase elongator complex component)